MVRPRSAWRMVVLGLLVVLLVGCGGASRAVEPSKPTGPPAAAEAALACGELTESVDPELDVVHWNGTAVEQVVSSPFVDIRRVVVSRDDEALCVDIETAEPPRKPSGFSVRFWDAEAPANSQVVMAELALLDQISGARLAYPGAEEGVDPRVEYELAGNHVRLRIPRDVFPDWDRLARFQWRVEARHVELENRDFEAYDHAPEPCIRIQWPDGEEYDAAGTVAC
jgi:hypothetical protein